MMCVLRHKGCLLNCFSHSLGLTFVTCVIHTEAMLDVTLLKIVRGCIRNSVTAALSGFLVDSCPLIVAVVLFTIELQLQSEGNCQQGTRSELQSHCL